MKQKQAKKRKLNDRCKLVGDDVQPDGAVVWRLPDDMEDNLDRNRMIWIENCRLPWLQGDCRANVYLLDRKRSKRSQALADMDVCFITGTIEVIEPWYPSEPGSKVGHWHAVFKHNTCDSQSNKASLIPHVARPKSSHER